MEKDIFSPSSLIFFNFVFSSSGKFTEDIGKIAGNLFNEDQEVHCILSTQITDSRIIIMFCSKPEFRIYMTSF